MRLFYFILFWLPFFNDVNGQQTPSKYLGEVSWRKMPHQENRQRLQVSSKSYPAVKISAKDSRLTMVSEKIDPGTITIHRGPTLPVVENIFFTGKKLPPPKIISALPLQTRDNLNFNTSYTDKKHGLPSTNPMDFAEDNEHNIWIASEKGLIRYDGYHYYLYEQKLVFGDMPDISMVYDDEKRLWWVSDNGAYFFRNDSMFIIKSRNINLSSIQCKRVTKDAANRIWISTKQHGVLCIEGNSVKIFDTRCGLPGNYIETAFSDKKGNLYLGCRDNGIVLIEPNKMSMFFSKTQKMKYRIFVSFYENEEGIWAGSFRAGLFRLGSKDTVRLSINGEFNETIYSITKATNGIWLSCYGGGVFYYNKKLLLAINEKNGLLNNVPYLIFQDSFNNLWVSNIVGFSRINDTRFSISRYSNPLYGRVKTVIPDSVRSGNWFTTFGKNLIFKKGDLSTAYTYRNQAGIQSSNYSIDGVLNPDGSLWIGTYGEGISRLNGETFTEFKYSAFIDNEIIQSIKKDAAGSIWFCPNKFGLITFDKGAFWHYTVRNGLLSNNVTNLFSDRNKVIYWSFDNGFQRKIKDDIETFYIDNKPFDDQVNCVLDAGPEIFFLGTAHSGLLLINKNHVYQISARFENASKNIRSIIADSTQTYWIGTETSIESFHLQGTTITDHKIYTENDGSYILDAENVFLDDNGKPNWSAGEDKLVFNPDLGPPAEKRPLISFKEIIIDSEVLKVNEQISILPNQKINIFYKTIFWGREKGLQLKYLLINNQADTTERMVQNNGNIIISDVLPGKYRILLKASDKNEIYYSAPVNFIVREYWYNSWPFRIILGGLILGVIFIYFKQKARKQFLINKLLEQKVQEQTKTIAKEKDELYKSYQTIDRQNKEKDVLINEINHRVKNNLQFISAILELQLDKQISIDIIQALLGTSRRIKAMSLVHELLYNKPELEGLSIRAYIHELVEHLSEMAIDDSNPVNIKMEVDDLLLNSKTALPLGMIISELVSNSFKHAFKNIEEPEVNIQLKKAPVTGILTLNVNDNGNGYQEKKGFSNGLGRNLVDIFSRQLEGTYTIQSEGHFVYELQFKIIET